MNNKKLGNEFEHELCDALSDHGWWVHVIVPNAGGQQPADIIAVKNGNAVLIDCKVCSGGCFSLSRIEDNQESAMSKWIQCGNGDCFFACKMDSGIYFLPFSNIDLMRDADMKRVTTEDMLSFYIWDQLMYTEPVSCV